jgi:hypothetical protein
VRRWPSYEAAITDLAALAPGERVAAIVDEWQAETLSLATDDVRRLFVWAWGEGNVPADRDEDVLKMLRWIAPVRDGGNYVVGKLTVFRGDDGAGYESIRWTLDESEAQGATSGDVYRATADSTDVLAHLTAGGRNQVLVDPEDLTDISHFRAA